MLRITALLVACSCFGQTPRDVAWKAYNSARQNDRSAIPDLAALVESYPGAPIDERAPVRPEDAAIEAVADALIQLKAALPVATIMHLYPNFPAQTIILLSRAPDNTAPLLEIYRSTPWRDLWLAAGNLLALHSTSEFVSLLLSRMVVSFDFRVVPQDEVEPPGVGSGCSGDSVMDRDARFTDWPKARMYRLDTSGHSRNIFAPGTRPVGFGSWETTDYRDDWTDGDCSGFTSEYWRTGLIAQLLGKTLDEFHLEPNVDVTLTYRSTEAFEDRVKSTIGYQTLEFQSAVDAFVRSGILRLEDSSPLHL